MKVLVTGASGFICGYLIQELLDNGYEVVGLDNFSKYGRLQKSYDSHTRYKLVEGDAKDVALMKELLSDCDHFVAAAAMIGGISYFHEFAYDLLAENERIIASSFDAAIWAHKKRMLKKIVVLSSSMVFESTTEYPTPEGAERRSPPPRSTYGFQKLAVEYFVQGAYEQYKLPYTIVRPFNCVGIGEKRALSDRDIMSGNVRLAMSHVVPDLVQKLVKGQDPLHILGDGTQVRHYTYGGDLARGNPHLHRTPCRPERGFQPLYPRAHHGVGTGRGDLEKDPRFGQTIPLRKRSSLRVRCPGEGAGGGEGAGFARL